MANVYLEALLAPETESDMCVLLLDKNAASLVALVASQTQLLKKNVGLLARLENTTRSPLRNMHAVVLSSPSEASMDFLARELDQPLYGKYNLNFNGVVSKPQLERLAEADQLEVVKMVKEMFFQYYVLNKCLFTPVNSQLPSLPFIGVSWDPPSLVSSSQTLLSMCLSLKCDAFIQYETNSKLSQRLGQSLNYEMESNPQLFDNMVKNVTKPMILILDRKNDPVTPLLFPWTYQSMVHELIGIGNDSNMVDLSHVNNVSKELQKVIMNPNEDKFYSQSMFLNFGDLSTKLKDYVEEYKLQTKTNSNIGSIKDMKFFLENYPQYKKLSLNLSKHMILSSEIDKRINELGIWSRSELEQNMCSNNDLGNHQHEVEELKSVIFGQVPIPTHSVKIIMCLYALKYESSPNNEIQNLLTRINNPEVTNIVNKLLKTYGKGARFGNENVFNSLGGHNTSKAANWLSHFTGNNSGDENSNIFMQCKPRLSILLEKIRLGQLASSNYATFGTPSGIPKDVIIYFVGGVTYEEARVVQQFNDAGHGIRVVIGGTSTVNSQKFLEDLSMM